MAAYPREASDSGLLVVVLAVLFILLISLHEYGKPVSPAEKAKFAQQEGDTRNKIAEARKMGTFIPGRF